MPGAAPSRRAIPAPPGPGPDLARSLADAARVDGGVAALDEADAGAGLPCVLDRGLAIAIARLCRVDTVTVRLAAAPDPPVAAGLGADSLRHIVRVEPLPDFGPAGPAYSCRPVTAIGPARFLALFERVFAPADLGLGGRADLARVAHDLQRGRPVQGRSDYAGMIVSGAAGPLGLFFLAGAGPVRELGFMGAVPGLRRRFGLRGALAAGVGWMRAQGIAGLTAEIAAQNSASLALARRLGARSVGARAVFTLAPDTAR